MILLISGSIIISVLHSTSFFVEVRDPPSCFGVVPMSLVITVINSS
uniref:Uncharacterized protein n=1 Tax=Arundo donax TaxID=35708 RepID=A0A0A9GRX2_ARUDO